ncbi:hypothetical protein D9M68_788970 [compost metagenome]
MTGPRLIRLSRYVGALVCEIKGHRYHYANGCYDSWKAYACIRCNELDRPLESLEPSPCDDFEDRDRYDEDEAERAYQLEARWFRCLPIPRWL